ncbi:MAG: hypothetical protein E6I58_14285 [Chloroflexi bacterium]|nr:MAG: hypothetical protein E6I58_14285 [Chloroflexota bacterium]
MTRDSFRREINREFDAMSGAPSPALSARVRAALAENRPARIGPPVWMAGMAAALIALIIVGVLVASNLNRHQTGIAPGTIPSPSPSPSVVATVTPSVSPSGQASPTSPAGAYDCNSSATSSTGAPQTAFIAAVRTGTHSGYDQVTIEFSTARPADVNFEPQSSATFTGAPSGQSITLAGQDGILITIQGADGHTQYTGPTDFKTNYSELKELRQVQDFEGTVQWALGLAHNGCYAYSFLSNPTRLVIYIKQ